MRDEKEEYKEQGDWRKGRIESKEEKHEETMKRI